MKGEKYSQCLCGCFLSKGIGIKRDFKKGIEMMLDSKINEFYEKLSTNIGIYYYQIGKESSASSEKNINGLRKHI